MTSSLARRILVIALVLGVAADWLFNIDMPRAGFALWVIVTLGIALVIIERATTIETDRRVLVGGGMILALMLVLRDAPGLYVLDFFAFVVVCALIAWRGLGRSLMQLEPRDAVIGGAATAAAVGAGAPMLALRDAQAESVSEESRRSIKYAGFGTIVALPVLLIVLSLLAEADPLFERFVDRAGLFLDGQFVEHMVFIGAASWVTAGAVRGSLLPVGVSAATFRGTMQLPFSAALPVLGGLALLLSAWIGLQVRTLFGGAAYVAETAGMTMAEYARDGFFELIVLAGIVLAVLLVADDVLDRAEGRARTSFRMLGQLLIALVSAVLVSAVVRLSMYVQYFGLTADRVIALAILLWVALVLVWFGMTVLRGSRARFAPGVLVISAIWLGALNLSNPERWVVTTNVARAEEGREFDVAYHAQLSGDALPTLLAAQGRLAPAHAAALRTAIDRVWTARARARPDWRHWSVPYALGARSLAPR